MPKKPGPYQLAFWRLISATSLLAGALVHDAAAPQAALALDVADGVVVSAEKVLSSATR